MVPRPAFNPLSHTSQDWTKFLHGPSPPTTHNSLHDRKWPPAISNFKSLGGQGRKGHFPKKMWVKAEKQWEATEEIEGN